MSRPRIALTANLFPAADRPLYKNKPLFVAEASMVQAVQRAGGAPLVVPFSAENAEIEAWLDVVQGLVLTGGADLSPESYGQQPERAEWAGQRERDIFEMAVYRACRARGLPVLGVCRGAQLLNVAEGGTLWQDIPTLRPDSLIHRDADVYDALGHQVTIAADCALRGLLGTEALYVNSVHHQGVRDLAPSLKAVAFAPDGVVEAMEHLGTPDVLAVQWHPEWMEGHRGVQDRLFRWLVDRAQGLAARQANLTL